MKIGESFYSSNKSTVTTTVNTHETAGAENQLVQAPILVAPNPASDKVRIEVPEFFGLVHYKLINILGEVLVQGRFQEHKELPVSHLSKGNYILIIDSESGNFQTKVMVH